MTNPQPKCPKGHQPDFFLVPVGDGETALMNPDGSLTNQYSDGTRGLTAETRTRAEAVDVVYCDECLEPADWRHGNGGVDR